MESEWCSLNRTSRWGHNMAERADSKTLASQLSSDNVSEGASAGSGVSWERFSQWVACVCVVTFDLELGQAMEVSEAAGYLQLNGFSLSLSLSLSHALCIHRPLFPATISCPMQRRATSVTWRSLTQTQVRRGRAQYHPVSSNSHPLTHLVDTYTCTCAVIKYTVCWFYRLFETAQYT